VCEYLVVISRDHVHETHENIEEFKNSQAYFPSFLLLASSSFLLVFLYFVYFVGYSYLQQRLLFIVLAGCRLCRLPEPSMCASRKRVVLLRKRKIYLRSGSYSPSTGFPSNSIAIVFSSTPFPMSG
jgi:hypothetical protein